MQDQDGWMHLVGFIIKKFVTIHGHTNVKFVNAKQAKETHQYRNTKEKLYKTNAAIWYNKIRREKQLTSNYSSILILLESSLQICMTYTIAECTVNKLLMMDRGTVRNM
jgi:hypothetical protein